MELLDIPMRARQASAPRGLWAALLTLAAVFLAALPASAQGTSVLIGAVTDAATRAAVADVAVVATAAELQGEQIVVTDASGQFRIPNLPPGTYTLRFEKESFKPYARDGIALRASSTIRVNVELLPETVESSKEIVVVGRAPTVDVGSSSTFQNINQEFTRRIAVGRPSSKGGALRSFESVAETAPGASADQYGTSINGASSPENQYVIDGLSVNDPAYGIVGTPLTMEFIKEVNVVTGGYMPEYGRSTGGVLDVVTKSGGNDLHGSVFFNITPGAFVGESRFVPREGTTISTDHRLVSIRDYGFEVGGPIVKDKLWFFGGLVLAFTSRELERNLNNIRGFDENDRPLTDENGFTLTDRIPGTTQMYRAEARSLQFIGKLTYQVNPDNSLTLSVYGTPSTSGGDGNFGIAPSNWTIEGRGDNSLNLVGTHPFIAHKFVASAHDVALRWSTASDNKRLLVDTTLGWHHQQQDVLPADGSEPGTREGFAGIPSVLYRRTSPFHSITDFEGLPASQAGRCALQPAMTDLNQNGLPDDVRVPCPVQLYVLGGPNSIKASSLDRFQLKAAVTRLFEGLGHHVGKAGIDAELMTYNNLKALSGRQLFIESSDGAVFIDGGAFGFLSGPDEYHIADKYDVFSLSTLVGGFAQDSWSVLDKVTLNLGVRYDAEHTISDDGELGIVLPNQWSPRLGVVYDPTQQGRSKLFANYARYYQSVPLNVIDRVFGEERTVTSVHLAALCDPRDPAQATGVCQSDASRLPIGGPADPNRYWIPLGTGKVAVDPDLRPQSSDEIVLGGEVEIIDSGRVGVMYAKRWLNAAIETMSIDEGSTFFIGNPGQGIGDGFPEARRDYDAVTLYFQKAFTDQWLAQASYTISYLRGNYSGLVRPETGQLEPNMSTDFDIKPLVVNRDGPLPGDRTHELKLFGAKAFEIPGGMLLDLGLSFRSRSGGPTNFLGAQPRTGPDEVFILPRGSGERLPWNHSFDGHIGYGIRLAQDSQLMLAIDVFNILNFQGVTATDNRYTSADVRPCTGEGDGPDTIDQCLRYVNGEPFNPGDRNPNFGNPTAYQEPLTVRLGARVTF